MEFLFGFPEFKVHLLGGSPDSQTDLYVLAKTGKELLPIMVEGKVSESFGSKVTDWKGNDPSKVKIERLTFLLNTMNVKEDVLLDKRYQLLHRTASTVIEANRVQAKNALVLVHSFSKNAKRFKDYADFVKLFQLSPKEDMIVGPVSIEGVNVYFGWVNEE